ncbi:hypothetical protein N7517_001920 [Penicillium concentricum]|uniref:HNH nuclease domain-containing protein n=1 Tax=Penicillium concentricum TaxID=293559 RepID=A0A9W9VKD0_9EURO|nr:uncharacterized protein N7517_001920 [Penicillium concentricum]KAJ5384009.1 hypothetical protein N7517_001920 [Penicillium concentricum]
MPPDRQRALLEKDKREPQTCRSVSDFLESKIRDYKVDLDYIQCAHEGLLEARDADMLTGPEYVAALRPFMKSARSASQELKALSCQRKILEEDLEEQASVKRQRQGEPDIEILERAYIDSILPKVMAATAKPPKNKMIVGSQFNACNFKRDVNEYYGIPKKKGFCHLTGNWDPADIKAAHLVPKSLSGDEIAHLFGVETLVLSNPSNALSLHRNIEGALDKGQIVIVPILSDTEITSPSRWKCVLTDESIRNLTAITTPSHSWRWNDFDQKELEFLSDTRPAKHFLYFRFIVRYIFCKKRGQVTFTDKVEAAGQFWPTPGPYLRKSMLRTLARSISGYQLPASLVDNKTFEDSEHVKGDPGAESGIVAAQSIYEAMIASIKTSVPDEMEERDSEMGQGQALDEDSTSSSGDEPFFEDSMEFL